MPIQRKTRLHAGSIHPTLVADGLVVDSETGILSGKTFQDEDIILHGRIDDLYWLDPIASVLILEERDPDTYRIGEALFSIQENNVYIYIGNTNLASADRSSYQPQSWIDANRTEKFLIVSAGVDADTWASREYVDTEISNLIGGAPDVLNTLNDLVTAINNDPNFGATILADLADLEQNKANKDDVYTKLEIDDLEVELLAAIDSATDRFSNVVDYVCGPDQDDDNQNFADLWADTKNNVSSNTAKNYLIKQNVITPEAPPIEIDRGGFNLLGFQPPELEHRFSHINNMIIRVSENLLELPVLTFKNISFNRFYIEQDSDSVLIIFNNCVFEKALDFQDVFSNQKQDCIIYFNNCQFYMSTSAFRSVRSKLYINNCKFICNDSSLVFSVNDLQESFILNSSFLGSIEIIDSDLRIEKTFFETTQNTSFINLLGTSVCTFQRITFKTPEQYDKYYFTGSATAYFDYNIVDISLLPPLQPESRVKQPTVDPLVNNGDGSDIYHFLDPLGSSNFFYNDEKARDAIALMFENSIHSSPITFTYNDDQNTLSLTLDLDTSDLNDVADIAFKNKQNTFTQENVFVANTDMQTLTASTITAAHLSSTSVFSTTITTVTQPQEANNSVVATTEYVRLAIDNLRQELFAISVNELEDATITNPLEKQVLAYVGGEDPAALWVNSSIDSTWVSDIEDFVKENDSIFRLSRITPPLTANQTGVGNFTGGYSSVNQVLAWNGNNIVNPDGSDGSGGYTYALSNNIVLYATEQKIGTSYDGAGKVWLASEEDVQLGNSTNKVVVPKHLKTFYIKTDGSNIPENDKQTLRDNIAISEEYALHDMSNIPEDDKLSARDNLDIQAEYVRLDALNLQDPDPLRSALGFALPSEPNILLESNSDSEFIAVKRALPFYTQSYIDFNQDPDNDLVYQDLGGEKFHFVNPAGSVFVNLQTEINETNYVILPTLTGGYDGLVNYPALNNLPAEPRIGPVVVRKSNGSTHETAGTLSVMCGANADRIMTSDEMIRNTVLQGFTFGQPQIDLLQIGHTVVFWPMMQDGDLYWYAQGYYLNSADQQNPLAPIQVSDEAVDDAIEGFFNHTDHSTSLSIQYNDQIHKMILTQNFATQEQVNAGTVSDLPIAPDTFKAYSDELAESFVQKNQNLADLVDVSIARENLQLGTLALLDSGSLFNQVPVVAQTLTTGYLYYDNGLKTEELPLASTLDNGILSIATLDGFAQNTQQDRVVLVKDLHSVLSTDNLYVDALKEITNTTVYTPTNTTTVTAKLNTYYSVSTVNGSVTVNLPEITDQPQGGTIKIKYRTKSQDSERIYIVPFLNQTIDNTTNSYVLDLEGQFLTLVLGIDGWEIN